MSGGAVTIEGGPEEVEREVVDLSSLNDADLQHLVVGLQAERARLAVASAQALADWDARGLWRHDGSRSAAHRLARITNGSVDSARTELRRARRVRHVPLVVATVLDGRLSLDHLDLLTRANSSGRRSVFAQCEQLLVDECAPLDHQDAVRFVR